MNQWYHLFLLQLRKNGNHLPSGSSRASFIDNVAPWSKLNWQLVGKIRQLYQEGSTQIKIAELFRLSQTTVSEIIRNLIWKDETYVYKKRKNR